MSCCCSCYVVILVVVSDDVGVVCDRVWINCAKITLVVMVVIVMVC